MRNYSVKMNFPRLPTGSKMISSLNRSDPPSFPRKRQRAVRVYASTRMKKLRAATIFAHTDSPAVSQRGYSGIQTTRSLVKKEERRKEPRQKTTATRIKYPSNILHLARSLAHASSPSYNSLVARVPAADETRRAHPERAPPG